MVSDVERTARTFWLEGFRDYLTLEAGLQPNTVESYSRDIRRLVAFAASQNVQQPAGVSLDLLRKFLLHLKDLGFAATSIRRQISAIRTYFRFLVSEKNVAPNGGQPNMSQRPGVYSRLPGSETLRRPLGHIWLPAIWADLFFTVGLANDS